MERVILNGEYHLLVTFYVMVNLWFTTTGALADMPRHCDIIGVLALACATTLCLRVLAIRFDWQSPPLVWEERV